MTAAGIIALIKRLAPTIRTGVALFNDLKPEIARLFQAGEITAEQQAELMQEVDDILTLFGSGELPAHWKIEPDPSA